MFEESNSSGSLISSNLVELQEESNDLKQKREQFSINIRSKQKDDLLKRKREM